MCGLASTGVGDLGAFYLFWVGEWLGVRDWRYQVSMMTVD